MTNFIARRRFLLQLFGLAGAGASAGLAIGSTMKAKDKPAGPALWFNGRTWHTHEEIDHFAGTWDIRWCYRPFCEHTVSQTGTTEDGYRIWHLKHFHRPPDPVPGEEVPPGAIDRTPPLRRYFQDDENAS